MDIEFQPEEDSDYLDSQLDSTVCNHVIKILEFKKDNPDGDWHEVKDLRILVFSEDVFWEIEQYSLVNVQETNGLRMSIKYTFNGDDAPKYYYDLSVLKEEEIVIRKLCGTIGLTIVEMTGIEISPEERKNNLRNFLKYLGENKITRRLKKLTED